MNNNTEHIVDLKDILDNFADTVARRVADEIIGRVNQQFVSREEFAQRRGISLRTVDRALKDGSLAFEREGRRVLIPANARIRE